MNLFKKIFIKNSTLPENSQEKKEVMINISSLDNNNLLSSAKIIMESQIPEFCSIGNLIYEKKYHEAIELGKKLLLETPTSVGVHVNLMDAYFKVRDENPLFYDKSIEHARFAMLYGHNTGYVQKKLAIGLEKHKMIYQAIQICDIVLNSDFHFSKHGCGDKNDFIKRKERLLKKVHNAKDCKRTLMFTDNEIFFINEQIRLKEERIITE